MTSVVHRRAFLGSLAGGLFATPLAAEARAAGRMYRIGYLFEGRPPAGPPQRALEEALRELGYVEGKNLMVERRFAAFKYDRLPDLAAELVRLKPDVIVTGGNPSIAALQQATTTVPIVMAWTIDPVGAGLITSLARPGGNITGSTLSTGPEFIAKQLEILNEAVPRLSRVGILRQTGRTGTETAAIESAARKLTMKVLFADVRIPSDIERAFVAMTRSRAGAFLILGGSVTWTAGADENSHLPNPALGGTPLALECQRQVPPHVFLWHRLLGGPPSENGRLRHGNGAHEGGDRRRRVLMLAIHRPCLPPSSPRAAYSVTQRPRHSSPSAENTMLRRVWPRLSSEQ